MEAASLASTSEVAAQAAAEDRLDDNLAQLDLHLTYLWRVHGVDYYGGREVGNAVLESFFLLCCLCCFLSQHLWASQAGKLVCHLIAGSVSTMAAAELAKGCAMLVVCICVGPCRWRCLS